MFLGFHREQVVAAVGKIPGITRILHAAGDEFKGLLPGMHKGLFRKGIFIICIIFTQIEEILILIFICIDKCLPSFI